MSDNWGLGLAGQVMFASMKAKEGVDMTNLPTWTSASFSLLFSATYN